MTEGLPVLHGKIRSRTARHTKGNMHPILTSTIYVLAGISIYATIQHLTAQSISPRRTLHLLLSGLCLSWVAADFFFAATLHATTETQYLDALKGCLAAVILSVAILPWLIDAYTEAPRRPWTAGLSALNGMLFIANLLLPYSIQFERLDHIQPLTLGWGETVSRGVGHNGVFAYIAAAIILATVTRSAFQLLSAYQKSQRRHDFWVLLSLGLLLATTIEGVLVRLMKIDFIETSPLGMGMVIIAISSAFLREEQIHLFQSEEKLSNLFRMSPLGIALRKVGGSYVDVNKAFEKICGYTAEELKSIDNFELTPIQYAKEEESQVESVITTGSYGPYEKEYRRKDGSLIPVRLNGSLITGQDGKQYVWSIIEDISESKRAEAAIRESERYLRFMLENLQTAIVIHVQDGSVTYMNSAARNFFGFEEGLTGMHIPKRFKEFFREDGSAMPTEELPERRVLKNRQAFYSHVVGIRLDNLSLRWALVNAFPTFDMAGSIKEVVVSFADITDRKNTETELVRTTEKLERLNRLYLVLSQVNAATVRVKNRMEFFQDICRILVESKGFNLAWIGLIESGELTPIVHFGHEDGYMKVLKQSEFLSLDGPSSLLLKTGEPQICQDIASDPRMAPWREEALKRGYRSSACYPIHLEGERIGIINTYADETDFFSDDILNLLDEIYESVSFAIQYLEHDGQRQVAEEELKKLNANLESEVSKRTRELEYINAELESFSYSVSHDLRAPLRHIDGFCNLLHKKYHDQLDEAGKDYLDRILAANKRMGELIEDLLELSKVGRSKIQKEKIDLSRITREVISGLDSNGRSVDWVIMQEVRIHADSRLMKIVMENLIRNAWKYSQSKEHAIIEFGSFEKEGQNIMYVRDNGVGFDMKYAKKLFSPFQRLHSQEEFEGTGVGLATVQRIIHRHGGRIWGEGIVDRGATFYLSLPD
jgi:PAS domain S-box-containing protein